MQDAAGAQRLHRSTVWRWGASNKHFAKLVPEISKVADTLGAGPALGDMWSAVGVPEVLPPRVVWRHNFQMAGQPCWVWMWLEPRADTTAVEDPGAGQVPSGGTKADETARLWWGSLLPTPVPLPTEAVGGTLLCFPASLPNPPLTVTLPRPGWVMFGHGAVPPAVTAALRVQHHNAFDLFDTRLGRDVTRDRFGQLFSRVTGMTLTVIARQLQLPRELVAAQAHPLRSESSPRPSEVWLAPHPTPLLHDAGGALCTQLLVTPAQLRTMREGRGMSIKDVVTRINRLAPKEPVSEDRLSRLEGAVPVVTGDGAVTVALPDVDGLLSRLDWVYQAGGRLGIDALHTASARSGQVTFDPPTWWAGPIWFQVFGPGPDAIAEVALSALFWGRKQQLSSGTVLTLNKPVSSHQADGTDAERPTWQQRLFPVEGPVTAHVPPSWRVVAGLGAPPGAWDVNEGWSLRSPSEEVFGTVAKAAFEVVIRSRLHRSAKAATGSGGRRRSGRG